jgi:hypothetical protein
MPNRRCGNRPDRAPRDAHHEQGLTALRQPANSGEGDHQAAEMRSNPATNREAASGRTFPNSLAIMWLGWTIAALQRHHCARCDGAFSWHPPGPWLIAPLRLVDRNSKKIPAPLLRPAARGKLESSPRSRRRSRPQFLKLGDSIADRMLVQNTKHHVVAVSRCHYLI